ncbi:MAG TPA: S41 family peptidase, partial [Candidatus Choladocola avistercoris]|nr:S41 family peptidase [Candidatus Choladocola avistercoris]
YTPAENNIHEVGITPDIVLEYDESAGTDNQLERALEVLRDS